MNCHRSVLASLLAAAPLAGQGTPVDEPTAPTVVVRTVDFRGKPPFERRQERLPVTEAARLEREPATIAPTSELVPVRTVDFRGKPPYRRRTEYVPVIDAARLEPTAEPRSPEEAGTNFRGRPPFRRHPR